MTLNDDEDSDLVAHLVGHRLARLLHRDLR